MNPIMFKGNDTPISIESGVARVFAFHSAGRTVTNPGFVWFDDDGREIAQGRMVDDTLKGDNHEHDTATICCPCGFSI